MRKFRYTVVYIEDNKLKHQQISDYAAFCARETFKEMKPNVEVLGAGLGGINKEYWKELKQKEQEILKEIDYGKEKKSNEN